MPESRPLTKVECETLAECFFSERQQGWMPLNIEAELSLSTLYDAGLVYKSVAKDECWRWHLTAAGRKTYHDLRRDGVLSSGGKYLGPRPAGASRGQLVDKTDAYESRVDAQHTRTATKDKTNLTLPELAALIAAAVAPKNAVDIYAARVLDVLSATLKVDAYKVRGDHAGLLDFVPIVDARHASKLNAAMEEAARSGVALYRISVL